MKKIFLQHAGWVLCHLVTPEDSTVSRRADSIFFVMTQTPTQPLGFFKMFFWMVVSMGVSFVIAQLGG